MSSLSVAPESVVSIHPYFKVHPGKLDAFRDLIDRFIARTASEPACLYYDFSLCDDTMNCREAYIGAAGVLAHVANVGDLIDEALTISELARIEIHGAAAELDQLRGPLTDINPHWFIFEQGLSRP